MDGVQPMDDSTHDSKDREFDLNGQSSDFIGQRARRLMLMSFVAMIGLGVLIDTLQPFLLHTLILMLVFALFAVGFDFAFGFSGMYSFGHAAMFGIGGYTSALLLKNITQNALLVLFLAVLAGIVMALLIGVLGTYTRDIYFAMISLAFAQIIYILAFQDLPAAVLGVESMTGGDNGIFGIPSLEIPVFDIASSTFYYYLFVLALVGASMWLIVRLANSRFGSVLRAIQQNEERVTHLGYDVGRYKLAGFAFSGALSALAGALFVSFQGIAHPNTLFYWLLSGEIIIMTLLGGMGTLWGPMIGAGLFIFIEETFQWFPNRRLLLAFIFVVVVIFFPNGLASLIRLTYMKIDRLRARLIDALR